jgi:bifunctional DNA-binding transcriptional regulator/antitoxin component of YhaV-PrlF toxin-antitoxin module
MSKQLVVTVTKKGQATIPKSMRERHRIGKKALMVDTDLGVLVKAIPNPAMERGSLKELFGKKTSRDLMSEIRAEESGLEVKHSKRAKR